MVLPAGASLWNVPAAAPGDGSGECCGDGFATTVPELSPGEDEETWGGATRQITPNALQCLSLLRQSHPVGDHSAHAQRYHSRVGHSCPTQLLNGLLNRPK